MHVNLAAGHGVFVQGAQEDGVNVYSAGGDGVYVRQAGSPSTSHSSSAHMGFEVAGAEVDGLYVGRADDDGVHVRSAGQDGMIVEQAGARGLHVISADEDGVYVQEAGNPSDSNPHSGHNGFEVAGAELYGLYVGWANYDGVYVYDADDDGVYVREADDIGVYANTTAGDHEWGFYTPDKIYAGTTLVSGGALMLVAQNGDGRDLETGDVVALSGMGVALGESDAPVPLVQRVEGANSSAAVGVVYRRFVAEEGVEELKREGEAEPHTTTRARGADGPVAPGGHMLIVVLGPAQVKAEGLSGGIRPGDELTTSSSAGRAMKAEALELNGVEFYAPGTTIGKAMEPLDAAGGEGLIWAWVTLQ